MNKNTSLYKTMEGNKKLTKEQYEKLVPFEKNLVAAYKNNFVHMSGSDFEEVAKVYAEIFQPLTKSQMGCNTCRLNALRKLGELFVKFGGEEKKATKRGRPKKLENAD